MLRVATINVLNDLSRWHHRRDLLVRGRNEFSPDLIAHQEIINPLGHSTGAWLRCPATDRWRGWKVLEWEIPMVVELRLRIVLERPPAGVDFGLQVGNGSDYKTVQTQRSQGDDLRFDGTVTVKGDRGDGPPNFLGPLAQGPPTGRFLYIDIGKSAGQADGGWDRRLKVPLGGITWEMIDRAAADSELVLEARLPGTGRDGGPSCATVHPPLGWTAARRA